MVQGSIEYIVACSPGARLEGGEHAGLHVRVQCHELGVQAGPTLDI